MPRGARLDVPGLAYHVMVRGIERRPLFVDDEDRRDMLARLERIVPEEGWLCFAWVLMPNHVHLVVQSDQGRLSRLMARLNTGFARAFNRRHLRVGYLFQNRFKSRLVGDDGDLAGLVAYVHRNPLRSKLVRSPAELEAYPWCGLGGLLGSRPAWTFESIEESLRLFSPDPRLARVRLRRWIARADDDPRSPLAPEQARQEPHAVAAQPDRRPRRAIPIPRGASSEPATLLDPVVERIAAGLAAVPERVRSPGARGRDAEIRAIVAWVATDRLGLRRRAVAEYLRISPTAVSHAARRGRALLLGRGLRIECEATGRSDPPRRGEG
jgi:REP element-mobilizing transposase RayT